MKESLFRSYSSKNVSLPFLLFSVLDGNLEEWYARNDSALPEIYRTQLFETVDDCKSTDNGKEILVSYSSGAVAIIRLIAAASLRLNKGVDGHDLQMAPGRDALFVTEETGAWKFNLTNYTFGKIAGFPDAAEIKSLGQEDISQYIYTIPEESYWTYHVRFFNPARLIAFPDIHVYKARWFNLSSK